MSRVTLVWEDRDQRCRTLLLPRRVVAVAVGAVVLLVATALALAWWSVLLRDLATDQAERIERLQGDLSRQRSALQSTREQRDLLAGEQERLTGEVEELRVLEQKIRRFLGLEPSEASVPGEGSHQGGMGPTSVEGAEQTVARVENGDEAVQVARQAPTSLRDRLGEVLGHLEERRSEALGIPVLLPVASDQLWLSCSFGWRRDPFDAGRREFHNGVDIAGPWKAPIISPADGTVSRVGDHRLLGRYVKIQHSDRIWSIYGHLATTTVERGQRVSRGEVIGTMGNSGRSTGTHLHYSLQVDGSYVNPLDYIWERPFGTLKL